MQLDTSSAFLHGTAAGEGDDGAGIGRGDRLNKRVLPPGQRKGTIVALALSGCIKANSLSPDSTPKVSFAGSKEYFSLQMFSA